jgi:hypothetical protein
MMHCRTRGTPAGRWKGILWLERRSVADAGKRLAGIGGKTCQLEEDLSVYRRADDGLLIPEGISDGADDLSRGNIVANA